MPVPNTDTFALSDVVNEIILTGIDKPIFTGSGINDMSNNGNYTDSSIRNYRVQVDGVSVPNTFRWSDTGGSSWNATGVEMDTSPITLNYGVTVWWGQVTGHVLNDLWDFECTNVDSLIQCFDEAIDLKFDPTYKGSKDRLSNFRNYGWTGHLTHENSYKTGSYDYESVSIGKGVLAGYVFCAAGLTGLICYSMSGVTLTYQDDHHTGFYGYNGVCNGGGYIFVSCYDSGVKSYGLSGSTLGLIDEKNDPGTFYDVWYQNGYLWTVGTYNTLAMIRVYSVVDGELTLQYSKNDIDAKYDKIWGDGSDYVYVSCDLDGVKSFHISGGSIVQVDVDDQGNDYNSTYLDYNGEWLFTAQGSTSGIRSHTVSNGLITYKSGINLGIICTGICGLYNNLVFFTSENGLYCYKINLVTGAFTYCDVDDQGGTYYHCDLLSNGIIYVASSGGIRVYSVE